MSSVTVNYQFRSFKINTSPSKNLNDVLDAALIHFKLDRNLKWQLTHNGKSLTMDLPWRLLNMPQGCNFDLTVMDNKSSQVKSLKIRFQIVGIDSIVTEVQINDHIALKIIEILTSKQLNVASLSKIKIRVFSTMYQWNDILQKTFLDLGILESTNVSIAIPEYSDTESNQERDIVEESDVNTLMQDGINDKNIGNKKASVTHTDEEMNINDKSTSETISIGLNKPIAYISSHSNIITDNKIDANDEMEMTVDQAIQYQNMLAKRAGTLGGPLLTKRLRELHENKYKSAKPTVVKCTIRVKFSDGSFLELEFHKDDTMAKVYLTIRENLINGGTSKFRLYQSHPHVLMNCNDQKLVDDLNFGKKNILICEFISDNGVKINKLGPFIKQSLLEDAKPITATLNSETSDIRDRPVEDVKPSDTTANTKVKKPINKIPKWLKLGKK